ncbi:exosortase/archaeosortase family protein [Tellurirhabdus bombi]|uniref:exosortase/archaeosortase family protein n=1 Tax=Tellurirhabdus bombi TaxID=2907205 RepID=UPI001F39B7F0|nr:exosortase/archaeosortase family protein [Tellurirhabdus bombi]
MQNNLSKSLDIPYLIKFFVTFIALYYFNIFYNGLVDPKNSYSAFLDNFLNYIEWLKMSILYTASLITHLFGVDSYVIPPQLIKTPAGATVIISYECLGLGVLSFWVAFVIANSNPWRRKLYWCLGGILLIWLINCFRIGLLLTALEKRWPLNNYIDHHDLFTIAAYGVIFLLIYLYSEEKEEKTYELSDLPAA